MRHLVSLFILLSFPKTSCIAQKAGGVDSLDDYLGKSATRLTIPFGGKLSPHGRVRHLERWAWEGHSFMEGPQYSHSEVFIYKEQKVHSIVLYTGNAAQSSVLLKAVQSVFGVGVQRGYAPHYHWQGKYVEMTYDENLFTREATLTIESLTVQRLRENDRILERGDPNE